MKYSRQREEILAAVREFPVHPTADELYRRLRQTDPTLSLGTVYRNLDLLSKEGLIARLSLPGEGDRFDGNPKCHHHMLCTHCGQVYDSFLPEMISLCHRVDRETGFQVEEHRVILYGTCSHCRNTYPSDEEAASK